ncbi:MAG: flagellar biosynthetic protein FliR [Pirellulales bacterium]|nr:flagellar biosynthetic protein FliR [Pirellulales bacterium]
MQWLTQLHPEQLIVFALVLTRVSSMVVIGPLFGAADVPPQIRALLAVALAMLVTPTQLAADTPEFANLLEFSLALASEMIVGISLGLGVLALFGGLQIAGQIIAQMSGISLAEIFNPGFDTSVPVFSQLLFLLTLAVFLLIGGDRLLLAGLLSTFAAFPPGTLQMSPQPGEAFIELVSVSFGLGMQTSAPLMATQLAATIALGLIGRALPQLNILALGFGLNALVTLGMLLLTVGGISWAFEDQLDSLMDLILSPATAVPHAAPPVVS